MKAIKLLTIVLAMTGIAAVSSSAGDIAAKVWYAEATGIEDPALHYGVQGSIDLSENLWISAMFLTGTYDGKNTDGLPIFDVDTTDAEAIIGYSFKYIDLGIGGRVTQWNWQEIDDEFWIFGPMVYAGAGNFIADSGASWKTQRGV